MTLGKLLIYGASGHGRVVADAARAAGWEVVGWGDGDAAKAGREIAGAPVLTGSVQGALELAAREGWALVAGIGDNHARRRVFNTFAEARAALASVIHPRSVISPSAEIGAGAVVFAGAVVNPDARIGRNAILNTCASVDHDCSLGDHSHISPGAQLAGTVEVGEGTHVGIGAAVKEGVRIGAWSVLGAGAVVIRDIPDRVVAFGVPASVRRKVGDQEASDTTAAKAGEE